MRTDRRGSIYVTLCVTTLLLMVAWPGAAAPARITPGVGIGPLTLGMRAGQVPLVLHKEVTPRIVGDRVVYDFPSLGLTAWATDDHVVRVLSRHAFHKTAAGIHPGQIWNDGILGMCGGMVLTSELPEGVEFGCPFAGISFEVSNGRITGIAVTRPTRR
ncbi:MAG TPA: hypothetical protein VFH67_04150 [bacterium]|nr:hypothetical protein [bacterium]